MPVEKNFVRSRVPNSQRQLHNGERREKLFPVVVTCAGELTLAIFPSYTDLKTVWEMALAKNQFHRV